MNFDDYPDLARSDEFYHHLPNWGSQTAVKRFTQLERRYVQRPLSEADLSQAWNRTVDGWIAEEEARAAAEAAANAPLGSRVPVDTRAPGVRNTNLLGRTSPFRGLGGQSGGSSFGTMAPGVSGQGGSGGGSSGATPIFVFGGAAYTPAPYRPVMMSFYYDVHDKVQRDMVAMQLSMQAYLNYKVPPSAVSVPWPYPQRWQAADFLAARGSSYNADIRSLIRGERYPLNSLGLSSNPGTYQFGISESRRALVRPDAPSYPYRSTLFNVTFR